MNPITIFTDPKAYTDPQGWHAVAARLRREEAVTRIEVDGFDPFWAITRHADVLEALATDPEQLRALQRDPAGIDNAVEEMIRWVTPVRHFLRYAQEAYELRGRLIAKRDGLLMSYLSANRDEGVFSDPFRFDVARGNASSHLAFGTGVHFCLGANLARMELRTFFRELLPRLEWIELAEPAEYTAATFVGAPKRVRIRYRLRA